jgi:hypothetical protein
MMNQSTIGMLNLLLRKYNIKVMWRKHFDVNYSPWLVC